MASETWVGNISAFAGAEGVETAIAIYTILKEAQVKFDALEVM